MKIIHVITKSKWGGAQRYVFDLAVSMKEKGHSITVMAGEGGPLLQKLESEGIATYSMRSAQRDVSFIKDIKTFFEFIKIVRKTDADIIHVNSSKMGGIGSVVGLILGKKTVFTAHGWPFQEKRSAHVKVVIWFLSWITGLLSQRVIVPSMNDFVLAQKMPMVGRKTKLIYLGREVDLSSRQDSREHIVSIVGENVTNQRTWIGFLAELNHNKGHRFLIDAAKDIDAQFFFMGEGELRKELENKVSELGLSDRILFLGHVDKAASFLPAFDCMVLPSQKEGLPYTIIESGLAGVPVLASNVGGIPEIIPESEMLFQPGSAKEIKRALSVFLKKDKSQIEAISSEFQEFVENRFSKNKMVEDTLELYKEVLDINA